MPPLRILCLNTGSSSLKFALYELGEREVALATGAVERIGDPGARLSLRKGADAEVERTVDVPDGRAAIETALAALDPHELPAPDAVGHRVVHGGPLHRAPEPVDARLLEALKALVPFAPLHLPAELEAIETVARRFPHLPQVVCFDTAFHRDMPEVAQRLPLPRALWDAGIRRYGFHGLSTSTSSTSSAPRLAAGSSSRISAAAPAWQPSATAGRSRRRWGSRRRAAS